MISHLKWKAFHYKVKIHEILAIKDKSIYIIKIEIEDGVVYQDYSALT